MLIIGLTGNTGTGKSTIASQLRADGVPVVDADELARAVVAPGSQALEAIAETFGSDYIGTDGTLRRKALGQLVFGDPDARRQLEAITHPEIAQRAQAAFQTFRKAGHSIALYDSAILVESGLYKGLDGLIVVTAERRQQIARIMARDAISRSAAVQRVDAQLPMADKVAVADLVIDNSGSPEALIPWVERLHQWLGGLCDHT